MKIIIEVKAEDPHKLARFLHRLAETIETRGDRFAENTGFEAKTMDGATSGNVYFLGDTNGP